MPNNKRMFVQKTMVGKTWLGKGEEFHLEQACGMPTVPVAFFVICAQVIGVSIKMSLDSRCVLGHLLHLTYIAIPYIVVLLFNYVWY